MLNGGNRPTALQLFNAVVENALEFGEGLFVATGNCLALQLAQHVLESGDMGLGFWCHLQPDF